MGFKSIFSVLLCLYGSALQAQALEFNLPDSEELPEATFGESQYADLLNAADSLELLGIGIRPDSIHQLLRYRRTYGPLLSPYELQQLPDWDQALATYCLQQLLLREGQRLAFRQILERRHTRPALLRKIYAYRTSKLPPPANAPALPDTLPTTHELRPGPGKGCR